MLASIVWNVTPEVIDGFHVRWYGVLFALGFLLAYQILQRILKHEGYDTDVLDGMTMSAFLGTIVGARLGHCLFYEPAYYLSNPAEMFMIWKGGLASHGGVIGVLAGFWFYAKKKKFDFMWVISRAAIVTPITGACIRLGNLMNSEIYGHETDLPWGMVFVRAGEEVAKHPTQLYEALGYLSVFAVLIVYYITEVKKDKPVSNFLLSGIFLIGIFTYRFLIEFVKNNQVDFESGMALNMGQILSLPFIAAGIYFVFLNYKNTVKVQA